MKERQSENETLSPDGDPPEEILRGGRFLGCPRGEFVRWTGVFDLVFWCATTGKLSVFTTGPDVDNGIEE